MMESNRGILHGKLGKLSLPRQMVFLALWPLLEQVLTFAVSFTDVKVAGQMPHRSVADQAAILDAMGLAAYVGWFFNILQGAVATGCLSMVSARTGARDHEGANLVLGQSLWLGVIAGIGSMLLVWGLMPFLLTWANLSSAAAEYAKQHLFVLAMSGPFSGAMFALNAVQRGAGDTRTPFYAMLAVNVVNCILSVTFVFAPAPWGGHGVAGIAAGTLCGWIVGCAMTVGLVGKSSLCELRWIREAFRPHAETMKRIVRVGLPQSFEIACMWAVHVFGVKMLNTYVGKGSLGVHMIAVRIESMSFLPGFAVAAAASTLAGQYLGANEPLWATRAVSLCWKTAAMIMGFFGILFMIFRNPFIEMMVPNNPHYQEIGAPLLFISGCYQVFFATCIILKNAMRAVGATSTVMRWSFGSMFFFRVIVLASFAYSGGLTLNRLWIIFAADTIAQAITFAYLFLSGKWLNVAAK